MHSDLWGAMILCRTKTTDEHRDGAMPGPISSQMSLGHHGTGSDVGCRNVPVWLGGLRRKIQND